MTRSSKTYLIVIVLAALLVAAQFCAALAPGQSLSTADGAGSVVHISSTTVEDTHTDEFATCDDKRNTDPPQWPHTARDRQRVGARGSTTPHTPSVWAYDSPTPAPAPRHTAGHPGFACLTAHAPAALQVFRC